MTRNRVAQVLFRVNRPVRDKMLVASNGQNSRNRPVRDKMLIVACDANANVVSLRDENASPRSSFLPTFRPYGPVRVAFDATTLNSVPIPNSFTNPGLRLVVPTLSPCIRIVTFEISSLKSQVSSLNLCCVYKTSDSTTITKS